MFGLKRFKIKIHYHEIVRDRIKRLFQNIKQIIVRQQFTSSPKNFILLCEITWKDRTIDPENIFEGLIRDIDVIEDFTLIRSEKNKCICFIKGIHDVRYTELFMYTTNEFLCFIEFPLIAEEVFGIINLVGVPDDVNRLIDFMKEFGSIFEIIAVTNYYSKDAGILSALTEKQLSMVNQAYNNGFFLHPRKTNARKIANELGIAHTTFLTHIRKAQNRIFKVLFEQ
jgi:predicted DNA binding protein